MPLRPLLHLNRPPKSLHASKHLLSGLSSFSNCDSVVSLLVVSLATIDLRLHSPVIAPSLKYESFTGIVVSTVLATLAFVSLVLLSATTSVNNYTSWTALDHVQLALHKKNRNKG